MASLATLRNEAKALKIPANVIRSASSAKALQEIIYEHNAQKSGKGARTMSAVAKKKKGGKAKIGSTRKASSTAAKKNVARKSTTSRASSNGSDKRAVIGKVNFNKAEGWNPRAGSPPDRIVKALKRFKGDRVKVFNLLWPDRKDFVSIRKRNGDKRTADEMEQMLVYRISRTAWEFATRTGQHSAAKGRVQYGTGGTGQGIFKLKRSKASSNSRKASSTKKKSTTKKKAARKR